ncbi:MAG: glycosyltransferase [Bacteroidetes bacterium]|nr:glycosyltransferase [Bacteroidota bacterium]
MNQPQFSIITVTYNAASLLPATFRSVAEQQDVHCEHVVVDGNSNDGSVALIEVNAQRSVHPVRWMSEPDRGLYDAMNKALALATGKYVLFLNAGDVLHGSDTLSRIAALPEADAYYGEALRVDEQGRSLGYRLPRPPRQLNWRSLRFGMPVCHQSFLVRRTCAQEYDTNYRIAADIDWMIRCLKVCQHTIHTHGVISHFLVGGISSQRRSKAWRERYLVLSVHYGVFTNFLCHLWMLMRYPFRLLAGQP